MKQGETHHSMHWLMLIVTLLASGVLVAVNLYQEYQRITEQENLRLLTQARLVRQGVLQQLQSTDHVLLALQENLSGVSDGALTNRDLAILVQGIPGLKSLAVLDSSGFIVLASDPAMMGGNLSANPAVVRVRQNPAVRQVNVVLPMGDTTASQSVNLALGVTGRQPRDSKILLATWRAENLNSLLASVDYAQDMWAAIALDDGSLFLSSPKGVADQLRADLAAKDSFLLRHKTSGQLENVLRVQTPTFGVPRQVAIVSVRASSFAQDKPWYVVVSREIHQIYVPWYREVKILTVSYGLVVILLLVGFWIYPRRQLLQEGELLRTERALQSSASRLQLATKAMGLGLWEYEPNKERTVWDSNMYAIYDVEGEALTEYHRYWDLRVLPEDVLRVKKEVEEAAAGLRPYDLQFRICRKDGEIRSIRSWGHVFRDESGAVDRMVGIDEDITERVLAEQQLAQRERDLKAILDNLPSLVGYWDTDLRNRFGNRTYRDWFGIEPENMPSMHLSALVGGELFQRNRPYALAALRGERQLFEQILPIAGTEEFRHTLVHYIPDLSEGGVRGFYAMVSDITQAKKTEAALYASELRYRTLAEVAPVGIFRLDENAKCIYVNEYWLEIFGLDIDQAMGDGWMKAIHPADRPRVEEKWQRATTAGHRFTAEFRYDRVNKQTVWVLARIVLEYTDEGLLKGYVGSITDISGIKRAEDQLRLAASVFANTQDGIVVTDPENRIVDVNPAFTQITGFERGEALGKDPKFLASRKQSVEFYASLWHILRETGAWRGELWNRRKTGEDYAELLSISAVRSTEGELMHYVGVFSDITRYKNYEAELSRMAHFDPLTGLPNRRLLADRLSLAIARARRVGDYLAVCYVDLDGFKPVNDRFGHEIGDKLLLEVSQRLQEVLRADDTVARLGGDEFVLLLNGIERVEECDAALLRVLNAVKGTSLGDLQVNISASIGVTLFPSDDVDADTLLRHADQAMYAAKEAGRNRYYLFDPFHDKKIRAQREALDRLYLALEAKEFCLYYQPKVNLISGEVIGAEALIRWQHPERGIVSPGEFLPIIEGAELEISLGEWVIETVLQQMEAWKTQGISVSVSANISPKHLLHASFIPHLRDALSRHPRIHAGELELEILESAAIGDIEQASGILAAGVALGVRFALDDFGTGYSSLTYFRRLPISVLKIDQTFIRNMLDDPSDLGIVDSVVRLAEAFDRPAIAEGVETKEHGAMLVLMGCHLAQGYGIARPMPAAQIPAWIVNWAREGPWRAISSMAARHADVSLLVAVHDEKVWFEGIVECIRQGGEGNTPALGANVCRLGRWWHGSAQRRYGTLPEFLNIGDCHESVHQLAAEILGSVKDGQLAQSYARLPELLGQHEKLMAAINSFSAQIRIGQS